MRLGAKLNGLFDFILYIDIQDEPTERNAMECKLETIIDTRAMTDTSGMGRRPRWLMRTRAERHEVSQAHPLTQDGFVEKPMTQSHQMNYFSYCGANRGVNASFRGTNASNCGRTTKDDGKTKKIVSKLRTIAV